jgi:osmotically-inducible protein OsmY
MKIDIRRAGIAAAVILGLSASALAADDSVIRYRIEKRLAELADAGRVQVLVSGGSATLKGAVETLDTSRRAERAARKEAEAVVNKLRVVPQREARDQARLERAVLSSLLGYSQTSIFDAVSFSVDNGVVTLLGSVHQPYRRGDLEARVARVPGVVGIDNRIAVQPVSLFDDDIRRALARQIYGDLRFVHFNRVNPPVRIIVNNGRVTLTGVVASRVDQVQLGMIARNSPAFGVDNQLVVESEQAREPVKAVPTNVI